MALNEIAPISNSAPGLAILNPIAVSPDSTQPAAVVSKSALAASSPTGRSAPIAAAPRAPAQKASVARRGGGGGASSSSAQQLVTDTYTTTVAGKSYSGSVQEETDGEYFASVPDLPGAIASGSSLQAAENNLATIIDALA
jgi:hypothetical protein